MLTELPPTPLLVPPGSCPNLSCGLKPQRSAFLPHGWTALFLSPTGLCCFWRAWATGPWRLRLALPQHCLCSSPKDGAVSQTVVIQDIPCLGIFRLFQYLKLPCLFANRVSPARLFGEGVELQRRAPTAPVRTRGGRVTRGLPEPPFLPETGGFQERLNNF